MTTPPDTVAIDVLEEVHVPPEVASVKVVLEPVQTVRVPAIAAGAEGVVPTVNAAVARAMPHVFVTVYVTVSTPAATPATTPPATVATEASDVVQTPPEALSAKVVWPPEHNAAVPVTVPAFGSGSTVTVSLPDAAALTPLRDTVAVYMVVAVGLTVTDPLPEASNVNVAPPGLSVTTAEGVPPTTVITLPESGHTLPPPTIAALGTLPVTETFVTFICGRAPVTLPA